MFRKMIEAKLLKTYPDIDPSKIRRGADPPATVEGTFSDIDSSVVNEERI
jgi:hypothetical protein